MGRTTAGAPDLGRGADPMEATFEPFELERWQSLNEHSVELNLSDSGVHPLTLRELFVDPGELDELFDQRLVYTQTNGTEELRARIAALHPGATPEHVEVTNGGAEANLLAVWSLLRPGDEVVVLLPNYMQVWGLARNLGARTRAWHLRPDFEARRWEADLDELEALVTSKTRMIALCNPNNPTGARLDAGLLDGVCRIAAKRGAWVLSDEIYRGSELDGAETPTVWGRHERVLVTGSLSKTYGLPGLRLGWVVGPPDAIDACWARHDYTTIGPGALSDWIAVRALSPETRARLLARTRRILTRNHGVASAWAERHAGALRHVPPAAGAMLYLSYSRSLASTELARRLRDERSVLVVPGDHYGMDGWLRIGFGGEPRELELGLERVAEALGNP